MSILNHFTKGKTPREVQGTALTLIEENWNKADVFVLNLPVAAGKSDIATTIARWANSSLKKKTSILTPTNMLVDQYLKDNPKLPALKRKDLYKCINSDENCKKVGSQLKKHCAGCPYVKDLRKARVVPYGLYNYYIYLVHRLFRNVLVVDEAHNLVDTLKDLAAKKIWQHEYKYPKEIKSYSELIKWLENHLLVRRDFKLEKLYQELTKTEPKFIVERAREPFGKRREYRDLLKLLPLETRDEPPRFWPAKSTQKIILLSATFGKKDVENIGLDKKRVLFLEANSPIEAERRPVIFSDAGNLSFKYQEENLPHLRDFILDTLADHPKEKGVIHLTYSLAYQLKRLGGMVDNPRLVWHDKQTRDEKYQEFLESDGDKVLMACGMYEGIDLKGDAGRWQILTKIPWPSLAEPAVRVKAKNDPEYYAWETIKIVIQAAGRICRTPTDYGVTYIADSTFRRLYLENEGMFPQYFKDSLKGMED